MKGCEKYEDEINIEARKRNLKTNLNCMKVVKRRNNCQ
jgi:hypothetical protein